MLKKNILISLMIVFVGLLAGFLILTHEPATSQEHSHNETGDHKEGDHEESEHNEEAARGPHGGRLLNDRDLSLEVQIVEDGIPPEFRIYPQLKGKTLSPESLSLKAKVIRLGKTDQISFKPEKNYLRGQQTIYEPHSFEVVFEGQYQQQTYKWHFTQEEGRLEVNNELIQRSGIQILKAGPQSLGRKLSFPGQIALDQDKYVHVVPPISGRAVDVFKHVGEKVTKGEVLAVFHSRELSDLRLERQLMAQKMARSRFLLNREESQWQNLRALLNQLNTGHDPEVIQRKLLAAPLGELKAELLTAFADLRQARKNYQREQQLVQDKVSSQQDYEFSQTDYDNALSRYRGAVEAAVLTRESAVTLQRQDLKGVQAEQQALNQKLAVLQVNPEQGDGATYTLRSPISGVVTEKHLAIGESVQADSEVFVIADLSIVWAEMLVPDAQLSRVRLGQKVRVISQNNQRTASGVISHNSPVVDPETRRAEAHAHIDNRDGFWRPGMFVTVEVVTDARRVPVAVAKSALQTFRDWNVVFARYGDQFEVRPLTLGEADDQWIEVLSGLNPGQAYAAGNSYVLKAELGKSGASHDH